MARKLARSSHAAIGDGLFRVYLGRDYQTRNANTTIGRSVAPCCSSKLHRGSNRVKGDSSPLGLLLCANWLVPASLPARE